MRPVLFLKELESLRKKLFCRDENEESPKKLFQKSGRDEVQKDITRSRAEKSGQNERKNELFSDESFFEIKYNRIHSAGNEENEVHSLCRRLLKREKNRQQNDEHRSASESH